MSEWNYVYRSNDAKLIRVTTDQADSKVKETPGVIYDKDLSTTDEFTDDECETSNNAKSATASKSPEVMMDGIKSKIKALSIQSTQEPQPSCSHTKNNVEKRQNTDSSTDSSDGSFEIISNIKKDAATLVKEESAPVAISLDVQSFSSVGSSTETSSSDESTSIEETSDAYVEAANKSATSSSSSSSGWLSDARTSDESAPEVQTSYQITCSKPELEAKMAQFKLSLEPKASTVVVSQEPDANQQQTEQQELAFATQCRETIDLCVQQTLLVPELKTGVMKFFNNQMGFGFITGDDGIKYFCHKSALQMNRFQRVKKGERVMFTTRKRDTKNSYQAIDVCGTTLAMETVKFRERLFRCYNCGVYSDHKADNCPQPQLAKRCCYICKSNQHLKVDCPNQNGNTGEMLLPLPSTDTEMNGSRLSRLDVGNHQPDPGISDKPLK